VKAGVKLKMVNTYKYAQYKTYSTMSSVEHFLPVQHAVQPVHCYQWYVLWSLKNSFMIGEGYGSVIQYGIISGDSSIERAGISIVV